jgi:hypothetical protein
MSDSESEGETIYETSSVINGSEKIEYDDSSVKVRKTRKDKGVKERSPAQIAATQKALQVLKERREAKNKADADRLKNASEMERQRILAEKYEQKKQRKQKLPPAPAYVTLGDLDLFKKEILGALPKQVYKAVEIERKPVRTQPKETPTPIPAPVAAPLPVAPSAPLSGHALLDKIFFSK